MLNEFIYASKNFSISNLNYNILLNTKNNGIIQKFYNASKNSIAFATVDPIIFIHSKDLVYFYVNFSISTYGLLINYI